MSSENSRYHCSATGEHIKVSIRARGLMQALRDATVKMAACIPYKDWIPISRARRDIVRYIADLEETISKQVQELTKLKIQGNNKVRTKTVLSQFDWARIRSMTVDQLLSAGQALLCELNRRNEASKSLARGIDTILAEDTPDDGAGIVWKAPEEITDADIIKSIRARGWGFLNNLQPEERVRALRVISELM